MGYHYFNGLSWDQITREERVFCAELYFHARSDPERYEEKIKRMIPNAPPVMLVALGTRRYFEKCRGNALKPFEDRFLTWEAVAQEYPCVPLFERVCHVYELHN